MRKSLSIPPPLDFISYSPSELFRFFFQIGRWTEDRFSADFQTYTRGNLISTVTVNKWKNRDVIPTRYAGPLFKLIEDQFEPDIATKWIMAFETVWASHIARPNKASETLNAKDFSDSICKQHCDWIKSSYEEKRHGERFSSADIYVPLQLMEREKTIDPLYDIEDLVAAICSTEKTDKKRDWVFIGGGPGSGKSMAAIHLAQEFCETNIFPIYLRGKHLSQIEIDIQNTDQPVIDSFSIKSFLEHFRSSSRTTACLILDGIDEISGGDVNAASALNRILAELRLEQNVCQSHNKRLHVIALGRQSHIEFAARAVSSETSTIFDLLGLDGRHPYNAAENMLGQDLRAEWWAKYLKAIGRKADPSLPDFLSTDYDDYSDFSSEPLLTYLICRIALEASQTQSNEALPHEIVNALTYAKNRNEIYQSILKHIHARTPIQTREKLGFRQYLSVLQHIALANWHQGEGRSVSLKKVHGCVYDEDTKRALQALNLSTTDMLITAFYYRIRRQEGPTERTAQAVIEFTHKTFSEYLISTLIFDLFYELIAAVSSKEGLNAALINWERVAHAGAHEPNLADFCQKEAALRYESFSNLDWDAALTVIRDNLSGPAPEKNSFESLAKFQRSASLLFFIWSCLNAERQKHTGVSFKLFETPELFSAINLKMIQSPTTLMLETDNLIEPPLLNKTFLTPSLSAVELDLADMSQLNFTIGHMQSLSCRQSSFAMTYWSHVKVTASNFYKSVFQQANFHGVRWMNTQFSNCLFQAVKIQFSGFMDCKLEDIIFSQCHFADLDFISTEMDGVIFDRCTFVNCNFDTAAKLSETQSVTFRYCVFLDMHRTLEKTPQYDFAHCIFQNSDEDTKKIERRDSLGTNIGDLFL